MIPKWQQGDRLAMRRLDLTDDERDAVIERAAIHEYDAGMVCWLAEFQAQEALRSTRPDPFNATRLP